MKRIDFKHFNVYRTIERDSTIEMDIRREFANLVYCNTDGIVAHDLAFRILHSENAITVSEEEETVIMELARRGRPVMYDSLCDNMSEVEEDDAD